MSSEIEYELKKLNKWKLRYAYILCPLLFFVGTNSSLWLWAYHIYGYEATRNFDIPFGLTLVVVSIIDYLPIVLPSTLIRFVYFKRGLNYGLELYISMILAIAIYWGLLFKILGIFVKTVGVLRFLLIYCILSYGSTQPNTMSKKLRYTLTVFTLLISFLLCIPTWGYSKKIYDPIWEATIMIGLLHSHNDSSEKTTSDNSSGKTSAHSFNENEYTNNSQNFVVIKLVNLGLAYIGRKTKRTNLFMTKEHDTERHKVEYAFLRKLAEKYRDAGTRKILAKHFMLYKETCLYIIFSLLLNNDVELHNLVKQELTSSLNDGLTPEVAAKRKDYMYAFSKAFYDEYKKNHNLTLALNNMFWGVASDKYTDIVNSDELSVIMIDGSLLAIYKYELSIIKNALDIH